MSTLTHDAAADAILVQFKAQWDADSAAVAGSIPPVEYDNLSPPDPLRAIWTRVNVAHNPGAGGQTSIGAVGERLFDRHGIVTIQVFVDQGIGVTLARALANIAVVAFEGTTVGPANEVWFRNVRMAEVGPTDRWFQVNVTAEFQYDTLK